MKPVIFTLLIIFGTIIVIGLGSVLLVLWAYAAGQVLLRILPVGTFNAFEATLLNLVGVLIVGLLVIRLVSSAVTNPLSPQSFLNDGKHDDDEEDLEIEVEDGSDTEEEDDEMPGIPRWRRPLKKIDFSGVKPNDPCPCGSGRKYKNCHGYKHAEVE